MAAKLSGLVQRFRPPEPTTPDTELLRRFTSARDEDAFAELVARHGPLVFGVCRRVTGSHHLSEDAFQAVFVVLAAKAESVRAASLPAFLHGVATRTALRARTVADRRRRREHPVAELPATIAPDEDSTEVSDLAALVDEEVANLSPALRAVVVLCELEGCSRKEAAERLGVPEGTVSSRLAAARKALADRLRRRGVALSAAGLSAALGTTARANVPAELAARALAGALSPALRPAAVAALSTGVLQTMLAQKLKAVTSLVALALGAFACVALAANSDPPAAQPKIALAPHTEPPAPKAAPKPLVKGPNKLVYWTDENVTIVDPDGKNPKELTLKDRRFHPSGARLSPDGKMFAYQFSEPKAGGPKVQQVLPSLHVRALDEAGNGTDLEAPCETFVWSPDGTELAGTIVSDKPGQQTEMTNFVVNVKSKEKSTPKLPATHVITDWAADGQFLTTSISGTEWANVKARLHLMNRDGTEHKALAPDTNALIGRISPDGTRVLCTLVSAKDETPAEKKKRDELGGRTPEPVRELAVLNIATGKFAKVQDVPLNADVQQGYCWSPDGKQIAYSWRQKHEGKQDEMAQKETESHLIVCDPDGKNAKTIVSRTAKAPWEIVLSGVDWR